MELKIEYMPANKLKEYAGNARNHEKTDIDAIAASIEEFGFSDPIGIWGDNIIVEGHGRLYAAKSLGMETVPVIRLDHMTDEQRRAYALAHNKTAELSSWNFGRLDEELAGITEIDMEALGFTNIEDGSVEDWFENRKRDDADKEEENEEYNEFLEKFEAKKTTDDCYTPDVVYDAVAEWVASTYGVERSHFVRPFFPGGDYQNHKYKDGDAVVDNPPFSILSEIIRFYAEHGIRFFLFAPTLTLFSSAANQNACTIPVGASVTYENKASVNTSFVTNLEDAETRTRTAPDLYRIVQDAADKYRGELTKELPKYSYPDEVLTAAMAARWSKYGIEFKLPAAESLPIDALDAQKEEGKAIYGKGLLLSERAAAERAAAERAAAERAAARRWELSERERERSLRC